MEGLLNDELASALAELPEALRPSVSNWLDRVGPEDADFASRPGALGVLLRVVACSEFAAATLRREWAWFMDNGADLSALAGKPVRLLFELKDADLYSFQFTTSE